MKVFALVCKGPRANFGQVGQIWHRRVFEDAAAAQSASVDFRKACVTNTGTAHDLENLEVREDREKVTEWLSENAVKLLTGAAE
jgi:hypothetical protein